MGGGCVEDVVWTWWEGGGGGWAVFGGQSLLALTRSRPGSNNGVDGGAEAALRKALARIKGLYL